MWSWLIFGVESYMWAMGIFPFVSSVCRCWVIRYRENPLANYVITKERITGSINYPSIFLTWYEGPLCIDYLMIDSFGCTVSAGIHPPDPFHLIAGFQRFRNALCICHLLYQPKKKRRLGITSKTALFCCGSERTLHGEAAAEEIGVRPNLVCLWATKRYFAVFAYEFEPSHSLSLKNHYYYRNKSHQ